jgi:hypothetical protein
VRPDSSPNRRILVAHDGELDDVCRMLGEIGGRFLERRGRIGASACDGDWGVVIASPQVLLASPFPAGSAPLRIAIVERSSRTALSMLRRAGVERIVRRPVHPAALRGLLLHTVYCGPEKRRRQRVHVGSPVRFRGRLWPRQAILSELSLRGCRLLTRHAAKRDASVVVTLPARLTGERSLAIRGRVVRTGPASGEDAGTQAIAVVFGDLSRDQLRPLQRVVAEHARGPATLPRSTPAEPAPKPLPAPGAPATDAPRPDVARAPEPREPAQEPESETDRRSALRRQFERNVIALGQEAARVLIGLDIAPGGMRVAPHPDLQVGDRLQLALHVAARTEPLIVQARVDRCDGPRGLVLQFEDLTPGSAEILVKMVDDLPPAEAAPTATAEPSSASDPGRARDRSDDPCAAEPCGEVVVSEILERFSA